MPNVPGKITTRLLKMFGRDNDAWFPGRPADVEAPKGGTPLPKGVEGHKLGRGRHRRKP